MLHEHFIIPFLIFYVMVDGTGRVYFSISKHTLVQSPPPILTPIDNSPKNKGLL